jgi:hypothetical protein
LLVQDVSTVDARLRGATSNPEEKFVSPVDYLSSEGILGVENVAPEEETLASLCLSRNPRREVIVSLQRASVETNSPLRARARHSKGVGSLVGISTPSCETRPAVCPILR